MNSRLLKSISLKRTFPRCARHVLIALAAVCGIASLVTGCATTGEVSARGTTAAPSSADEPSRQKVPMGISGKADAARIARIVETLQACPWQPKRHYQRFWTGYGRTPADETRIRLVTYEIDRIVGAMLPQRFVGGSTGFMARHCVLEVRKAAGVTASDWAPNHWDSKARLDARSWPLKISSFGPDATDPTPLVDAIAAAFGAEVVVRGPFQIHLGGGHGALLLLPDRVSTIEVMAVESRDYLGKRLEDEDRISVTLFQFPTTYWPAALAEAASVEAREGRITDWNRVLVYSAYQRVLSKREPQSGPTWLAGIRQQVAAAEEFLSHYDPQPIPPWPGRLNDRIMTLATYAFGPEAVAFAEARYARARAEQAEEERRRPGFWDDVDVAGAVSEGLQKVDREWNETSRVLRESNDRTVSMIGRGGGHYSPAPTGELSQADKDRIARAAREEADKALLAEKNAEYRHCQAVGGKWVPGKENFRLDGFCDDTAIPKRRPATRAADATPAGEPGTVYTVQSGSCESHSGLEHVQTLRREVFVATAVVRSAQPEFVTVDDLIQPETLRICEWRGTPDAVAAAKSADGTGQYAASANALVEARIAAVNTGSEASRGLKHAFSARDDARAWLRNHAERSVGEGECRRKGTGWGLATYRSPGGNRVDRCVELGPEQSEALALCDDTGNGWLCDGPIQKSASRERDIDKALDLVGCGHPRDRVRARDGSVLAYCSFAQQPYHRTPAIRPGTGNPYGTATNINARVYQCPANWVKDCTTIKGQKHDAAGG